MASPRRTAGPDTGNGSTDTPVTIKADYETACKDLITAMSTLCKLHTKYHVYRTITLMKRMETCAKSGSLAELEIEPSTDAVLFAADVELVIKANDTLASRDSFDAALCAAACSMLQERAAALTAALGDVPASFNIRRSKSDMLKFLAASLTESAGKLRATLDKCSAMYSATGTCSASSQLSGNHTGMHMTVVAQKLQQLQQFESASEVQLAAVLELEIMLRSQPVDSARAGADTNSASAVVM